MHAQTRADPHTQTLTYGHAQKRADTHAQTHTRTYPLHGVRQLACRPVASWRARTRIRTCVFVFGIVCRLGLFVCLFVCLAAVGAQGDADRAEPAVLAHPRLAVPAAAGAGAWARPHTLLLPEWARPHTLLLPEWARPHTLLLHPSCTRTTCICTSYTHGGAYSARRRRSWPIGRRLAVRPAPTRKGSPYYLQSVPPTPVGLQGAEGRAFTHGCARAGFSRTGGQGRAFHARVGKGGLFTHGWARAGFHARVGVYSGVG
jgi:hypothetical protein